MAIKYIALFDLDRTIFSINSSNYLVWHAFRTRKIGIPDLMHALYLAFLYRTGWRDTFHILNEMTSWIKGASERNMALMAEHLIKDKLLKKIRPQIFSEIQEHKEKGALVAILSAALPILCHPIASILKIDDVICTEMVIKNGIYTGKSKGQICYAEEKLNRLIAYCKIHGFSLEDAYYYADSISDIFVLEKVGFPVCIQPDRRLRKAAIKNNWPIPAWS